MSCALVCSVMSESSCIILGHRGYSVMVREMKARDCARSRAGRCAARFCARVCSCARARAHAHTHSPQGLSFIEDHEVVSVTQRQMSALAHAALQHKRILKLQTRVLLAHGAVAVEPNVKAGRVLWDRGH